MSKIVLLRTGFCASSVSHEFFQRLKINNPVIARYIKGINHEAIVLSCARKAIEFLGSQPGFEKSGTIQDYSGYSFSSSNGIEFIGALKTRALPGGIGVMIGKDGKINFAADVYRREWKIESEDIQRIFLQTLKAEIIKSCYKLLPYRKVDVRQQLATNSNGKKEILMTVVGEK